MTSLYSPVNLEQDHTERYDEHSFFILDANFDHASRRSVTKDKIIFVGGSLLAFLTCYLLGFFTTSFFYTSAPTSCLSQTKAASGASLSIYRNGVDHYLSMYNRWHPVCSNPVINSVLSRTDGFGMALEAHALRPWSLTAQAFDNMQPTCETVESLIDSARFGQRFLLNSSSYLNETGSELSPSLSAFLPRSCSLQFPSNEQLCDIIHKFAHIIIPGDSMSRHTVQALFGLLREDLRYGGLPYFGKSQLYEACQCDGQFSEHVQCRDYDMNVYAMQDLRSLGVCYPKVPQAVSFNNSRERQPFQPTRFDHHFHGSSGDVAQDRYSFICKSSLGMIDPRPRLVILQAAGHFGMSVERTTAWIDKITGVMNNQSLKCEGGPVKMHYVFVGATTQIRSMDAKYPHQTREKAAEFNENVRNHLQKLNIPLLDFRPLTADTQTSDGGHHLHEVNLLKSMYLMNFARLVLEQASAEPEVEE